VGINPRGMIPRFLELFDPDFFLLAGRYTLLEQDVLDDELPACVERGVGIVIGAPFNSGLLAVGAAGTYDYRAPAPQHVEKVQRIQSICARHGVSLPAAALQFVLAHPAVASVIPGPATPEEARANVAAIAEPIAAGLWTELRDAALLRADAPVPQSEAVHA